MIILIGFEENEAKAIEDIDEVYMVSASLMDWKLSEIISKKPNVTYLKADTSRIVILHGVENRKISPMIREIRSRLTDHIIFATSTPTSMKWTLKDLVKELEEEDAYFRGRR